MEVSSNIWFAHAGLEAGADGLSSVAARFGFGSADRVRAAHRRPARSTAATGRSTASLTGWSWPTRPTGRQRCSRRRSRWRSSRPAIANDGVLMQPTLVDRLVSDDGNETRIEPRAIGRVMTAGPCGDAARRHGPGGGGSVRGGAMRAAPRWPVSRPPARAAPRSWARARRPHSWFVGFAPADEPRIAIAVVVENARFR